MHEYDSSVSVFHIYSSVSLVLSHFLIQSSASNGRLLAISLQELMKSHSVNISLHWFFMPELFVAQWRTDRGVYEVMFSSETLPLHFDKIINTSAGAVTSQV